MGRICSCRGGNETEALLIEAKPESDDIKDHRSKWLETINANPNVITLSVQTLWEVMSEGGAELKKCALEVEKAFNWICSNPQVHQTHCRFTVSSDWGEIALLNPSAFIKQEPKSPPPTNNVNFTSTKISFGKEQSHKFERTVTIE